MTDPRERIETNRLLCVANSSGWTLTRKGPYAGAARVPWPELVAFSEKILAANVAWLTRACVCEFADNPHVLANNPVCREYLPTRHKRPYCKHCKHDEACHEGREELTDGK